MESRRSCCNHSEASAFIACCLAKHIPFYACRYPDDEFVHVGAQYATQPVHGLANGFRMVPFVATATTPTFTIVPDMGAADVARLASLPALPCRSYDLEGSDATYEQYIHAAEGMVQSLRAGEARKIVLSRTITRQESIIDRIPLLFTRLCSAYRRAFVFVVSYPGVCGWLGATPEVLLHSTPGGYATMALAGTRPAGTPGEWYLKEREEQQYVTDYIAGVLQQCGVCATQLPACTLRAAGVEHLCTHFDIVASHSDTLRDAILGALHPTPAVAGIPVDVACRAIVAGETHRRRYYSGYLGEAQHLGLCQCFVNLRCLEFTQQASRLYVGGGLTARSVPADEWNETCLKALTLLSIMNP